jgi:hypothetical protein
MPTEPVTLIKGDKIGIETDYRDALPVNAYAVNRPILGASGYMMLYPGLVSFGTGSGKDRGAIFNDRQNNHFRVSGNKLISVASDGTVTVLGTVTGTEQVAMPYSFNTQCVISNNRMFLYDTTNGFRQVLDEDLGNPIDGVWIDGYYFLTDGEYIYHTKAASESEIDPLSYATAEFMPDPSLGLAKTKDDKVIVFGRYTTEYFVNTATANFAFQRLETRAQKIGIVATHAKCESNGNFYITGGYKNGSVSVYLLGIGSATKVSTREIDKVIAQYTEPELVDMRMEARTEGDITFILVHLPNETLCFNETIASSLGKEVAWSILKSDIKGSDVYRAINGINDSRISKWIYGDKLGTTLGYLSNDVNTHYSEIVESILYTPLMAIEGASIDQIEIETLPGHNTVDDAKVACSLTFDGVTYGSEWWALYGIPADRNQRFIIRRLGYIRHWAGLKFRIASTSRMGFALVKVTYS